MSVFVQAFIDSFNYQMMSVYTSIPCVIVNVKNINEQRIDVQPLINNIKPDGTFSEHPVILSVPFIFPSTKNSALTFEVVSGDTVLCMFSQKCIDTFKAGANSSSSPIDLRRFDKRDAIALLGLAPFDKAANQPSKRTWDHNTSDTVLVHNIGTGNEVEIRLKKSGQLIINTNQGVEVNCNTAEVNASTATVNAETTINGNLTVNGNIDCSQTVTATTDVIGGGKSLKNHTHNVVNVQAGGSTIPTQPPT